MTNDPLDPIAQNTPKNQDSIDNPSPTSLQEPTEPASENEAQSTPTEATPEPQTAQGEVFESKVESEQLPENQDTEPNEHKSETNTEPENEPGKAPESSADAEAKADKETAQTPVNEPFEKSHDEPLEEPETQKPEPEKKQEEKPKVSYLKSQKAKELLILARNAIQFRKRKKLDRIMSLFLKQSKITNDEIEKFLHVSDATATRYLSQLEKEGKIKQSGKTGKGVSYSRI